MPHFHGYEDMKVSENFQPSTCVGIVVCILRCIVACLVMFIILISTCLLGRKGFILLFVLCHRVGYYSAMDWYLRVDFLNVCDG